MQIQWLSIDNKKCLKDFYIPFNITDGASTTILIGENGAGKSNMMEAILEILMSFDSPAIEKEIDYSYELKYEYAQKSIFIKKDGEHYLLVEDGTEYVGSYSHACAVIRKHRLFPKRVIAFYSGLNNKLEPLIRKMNTEYQKQYRRVMRGYFYVISNIAHQDIPPIPVRKYNFCDEHMVPTYLCALLEGQNFQHVQDSFEKQYLQKECHFGEIIRIDMTINLLKVDQFFNGIPMHEEYREKLAALAEYIDRRFIELLYKGWRYASGRTGYLVLEGLSCCEADSVAILEFFETLHDLFGAQYEAYVSVDGNVVKSSDLSEGQRQLIKVLGMMGICKNEDCLILLDEPDAHMNPKWKYEIKKIMDGCLEEAQNAQAIIATHDPLVINGVDKDFIRIFEKVESETVVRIPTENTAGMGIDGLLQSQYYRLQTSYDEPTFDKFRERQLLYIKLINDEITDEEKERLRSLTKELGSLPKSYTTIDFLYDDFIKVYRNSPLYHRQYLSFDELDRRRDEIEEIIKALYEAQI